MTKQAKFTYVKDNKRCIFQCKVLPNGKKVDFSMYYNGTITPTNSTTYHKRLEEMRENRA